MGSYSLELYTWRSLTSLSDLHVQLAHLGFRLLQFPYLRKGLNAAYGRGVWRVFLPLPCSFIISWFTRLVKYFLEIFLRKFWASVLTTFPRFYYSLSHLFCKPCARLAKAFRSFPWNIFIIHQIWNVVNSFLKVFWKKFMRIVLHLRRRV